MKICVICQSIMMMDDDDDGSLADKPQQGFRWLSRTGALRRKHHLFRLQKING